MKGIPSLLEKKRQGMPAATVRPFVAPTTVVNLMDALRRSIAEDAKAIGTPKKATTPKPKKGKERILGQGELLLPIAGRKEQPETETKPATQPTSRRKSG